MKNLREIGLILVVLMCACSDEQCPEGNDLVDGQCVFVITQTPELTVQPSVKTLNFSWNAIEGADNYKLLQDSDGTEEYTQLGEDLSAETLSYAHQLSVYLYPWDTAQYKVQACNALGCVESDAIGTTELMLDTIGVLEASNADLNDSFGSIVATSADGNTLAISAPGESSSATGINGNESDNGSSGSGAVYVFVNDGDSGWLQQAYIKASNTDAGDHFGSSLALSADGSTLVVGAWREGSSSTGIDGEDNNDAPASGAVYAFTRSAEGVWSQQAYIKASNTEVGDFFGTTVALSADGDTLAVGARGEKSSATGINGDQADNQAQSSGAVYVFTRSNETWSQQAYIKASNTGAGDYFGAAVALSGDGTTLAVGAIYEDSANTDPNDDSASEAGATYVFVRGSDNDWFQQAYLKASNTDADDNFGSAVALSADGNLLGVSTFNEASSARGIDGDQLSNHMPEAGAVYLFERAENSSWSQTTYIKASNTDTGDGFGFSLALSADGSTLAVGAVWEASNAVGINGDQSNNDFEYAGAIYVFRHSKTNWSQIAYVKLKDNTPISTEFAEFFGISLSLDEHGDSLFAGAPGVEGADISTGTVYLY
ncbi:MAG: integrin [Myxococcales bacterium]|nr:MAG: integrin [Myxococcales bacterium]